MADAQTADVPLIICDLRKLSRRLDNKKEFKPLCDQIERVYSTQSAVRDLELASRTLNIFLDRFAEHDFIVSDSGMASDAAQSEADALQGSALFAHAVSLYTRATKTSHKARRPSGIADRLPSEFRELHKRITSLRDEAMAHVSGGGEGWLRETVVLIFWADRAGITHPFVRYNSRGADAKKLDKLIRAGIEIGKQISAEREKWLSTIMPEFFGNSEFRAALRKSEFVAEEMFAGAALENWNVFISGGPAEDLIMYASMSPDQPN